MDTGGIYMTVTAKPYGKLREHLWKGRINYEEHYIRVMLCTNEYSPNRDTHDFKDDVAHEVSGDGYIPAGMLLENKTLTYDAATNTLKLDADNLVWPDSTITARYAVIYDASYTTNGTMPLIGYVDFGEDILSTGGSFSIEWGIDGVLTDPVAA